MDDDLYSALIGGVPSDPQRQMALASALRRQNLLGTLGEATGDRVMGPAGQHIAAQATSGAEDLGKLRQAQMAQQIEQQFHQDEMTRQNASLAEEIRSHNMQDARQRELTQELITGRQNVADTRVENKPPKVVPVAAKKELDQMVDSLDGVRSAQSSYQPGFGGQGALPIIGRSAENWLAQKAPLLASQNGINSQNWWANYGRLFTLPELKNTIGIRHNQYMQQLFESYHLDPNMNDAQITKNLGQIGDQLGGRVSRRLQTLQSQGYDISGYEDYLPGGAAGGGGQGASAGDQYVSQINKMRQQAQQSQQQPGAMPQGQPAPQPRPQPQVQAQPQQGPVSPLQQALSNRMLNPLQQGSGSLFNIGGQ
jgi:hypothetical protein